MDSLINLFNKYSLKTPYLVSGSVLSCGVVGMKDTVQLNEKMHSSCPAQCPKAGVQACGSPIEESELKTSWTNPETKHSPSSIQHSNCSVLPSNQEK